ncbi:MULTISPECIES: RNA 2',3'-cyclic phosphodiesterase [unclassified Nitrospina]|uniref:RNA 2',3'-cyclic phosphodiesterase n=1 Tax=unclassified Nitrospina TaxID=2638683 RepID=UPI003F99DF0C
MLAIRTFVAVLVPSTTLNTLSAIQDRFKKLGVHATWTRPGNIHLTLKFLGDTDPHRIPEINTALDGLAAGRAPFQVSLGGLGVFPGWKKPRVVWVGLDDREGHLASLQSGVESAVEPLGWPRESRAFSPHLTLGRIKSPKGCERLKVEMDDLGDLDPSPIQVKSFSLIQSKLTPKGSIYTVLKEISLQGRSPDP